MKVSDIINCIADIKQCQKYLQDWVDGEIQDFARIEALARDIDEHLDCYTELLKNKEVK